MSFASNLKNKLNEKELKPVDLAKGIGKNKSSISQYLSGSNIPKNETKKLLYVVCSRAKKNLFLFSEQGRTTQKGAPLLSTDEILEIDYEYDSLEVN